MVVEVYFILGRLNRSDIKCRNNSTVIKRKRRHLSSTSNHSVCISLIVAVLFGIMNWAQPSAVSPKYIFICFSPTRFFISDTKTEIRQHAAFQTSLRSPPLLPSTRREIMFIVSSSLTHLAAIFTDTLVLTQRGK